jgi:hypothetical protein
MAGHSNAKTTGLYDRRNDDISVGEVERIQVRVLRVRYGAHEGGPKHEHILKRVVVYVTDQANGKAREVHVSGAMTHSEENSLDQPVERVAVELK